MDYFFARHWSYKLPLAAMFLFSSLQTAWATQEDRLVFRSSPRPQCQIRPGDTLQKLGALSAGGSAKSYLQILKLNRHIRNPNLIRSGTWLNLARIPSESEKELWSQRWFTLNEKTESSVFAFPANTDPDRKVAAAPSLFDPNTEQEKRELISWYLERLDPERDRKRMDALVAELLAGSSKDWNDYYIAGKYFARTNRPAEAMNAFAAALQDEHAPIQTAVLFVRMSKAANREPEPAFLERLFQRYPSLKALQAAEAAENE